MKLVRKVEKKVLSIDGKIKIISPLKIDFISEIFLCTFNDIKSVIRVDFDLPNWLQNQRSSELYILNFLKDKRQDQNVLYYDLDSGILIREFHEGKKILDDEIRKKENLISLGDEIKKVHEIETENFALNDFKSVVENYRLILKNKIKNDHFLDQGFKIFDSLSYENEFKIFSHNDLTLGNILWNKKCFFIDWEYASMNSPYFDLASIISSYNLNNKEIVHLLEGYNKNNCLDIEKLRNWTKFTYFLDYIWKICLIETTKYDEKNLNISFLKKNLSTFK
ncbi:phosphotransferase [Gammaproteobacteria bacterium]|jgi:thiamine kinase-like enzyme|nr:phosphotransferase [Gammaproteobacteria bacterium]MDC0918663.1 phosphotransferase [Gammaproteobacteria bacterium]